MMNFLGKGLVLLHVTLSFLALSWAAAIFLQYVDWGWKEPRGDYWDTNQKKYTMRVASEIDKRSAALNQALIGRDTVMPEIKPQVDRLREAQKYFPVNHLWYQSKLASLRNDKEPIVVKEIKTDQGVPLLESGEKPLGVPVLDNLIPNVTKSQAVLEADLKKINADIEVTTKQIDAITKESKKITSVLNGFNEETGAKERPGIYDLIQYESRTQSEIKVEMEDVLKPRWVDAVKEAELFVERRARLEADLKRILKNQR